MVMEQTVSANTINTNNDNNNTSSVTPLSPHSVGREFVRQYYTMLNKGPQHLHRFYYNDSSFVHGGVDKPGEVSSPVYGRDAISKKIDSLNFCDCHAKILQVDCMETIANGIVIQITGELSNNGEQMRRFLQTFVLAPLGHNKYYVRNDIFRYQDEIFSDDDEYTEANKTEEIDHVELEQTAQPKSQQQQQQQQQHHQSPPQQQPLPPRRQQQQQQHQEQQQTKQPEPTKIDPVQSTTKEDLRKDFYENLNGNGSVDEVVESVETDGQVEITESKNIKNMIENNEKISVENEDKNDLFIRSSPIQQQQQQNEQKTYANMVSKNANGPFGPAFSAITSNTFTSNIKQNDLNNTVVTNYPTPESGSVVQPTTGGPTYMQTSPGSSTVSGKPPQVPNNREQSREYQPGREYQPRTDFQPSRATEQQQGREQRNRRHYNTNKRNDSREMTPGRGSNDNDTPDNDYPRKQYPDEQQVFVGNLTQQIVEDDLRQFFSSFGKILDVRINRQNQKLGANQKTVTPNYGFVTFENPDIVQLILKQKPIFFCGHRVNVEEKRSQQGKNIQAGTGNSGENTNRNPGSFNRQSGAGSNRGASNNYGNSTGNRSQSGNNQGNRNRGGNQPFVPNTGNLRSSGSGGGSSGGFNTGSRNNFNKSR